MFTRALNWLELLGKRLTLYVREIRITADFSRYESHRRDEYVRDANTRFSTVELERRISSAIDGIEIDANSEFKARMDSLTLEIGDTRSAKSENEAQTQVLGRDYAEELGLHYAQKNALHEEKSEACARMNELKADLPAAYEAKEQAYADLKAEKAYIESWHRSVGSRKGGVPKYSVFGPSMNKLRSSKSSRDSAYSDIQETKDAIASIKDEIGAAYERIQEIRGQLEQLNHEIEAVKHDRANAEQLRWRGITPERLERQRGEFAQLLQCKEAALDMLQRQREKYVEKMRQHRHVNSMEDEVLRLEEERKVWLEAFDLEDNRRERMAMHREEWLIERELK